MGNNPSRRQRTPLPTATQLQERNQHSLDKYNIEQILRQNDRFETILRETKESIVKQECKVDQIETITREIKESIVKLECKFSNLERCIESYYVRRSHPGSSRTGSMIFNTPSSTFISEQALTSNGTYEEVSKQ